jgi:hypothetical protein
MRLVASALLFLVPVSAAADYKIVTRTSSGKNSFLLTRLIQGERQRTQMGNGWVSLYQCDRHQLVQLNPETKLYRILKLAADGYPVERSTYFGRQTQRRLKVVTSELPERATVFGRSAWHVQDVIDEEETGFRTTIDSWYIDAPIREGCLSHARTPWPLDQTTGIERTGDARRGFPVLLRRVYLTKPTRSEWVEEVTELTETRLDPALFEIPHDYREALDNNLMVADTPTNRAKRAWNNMWTSLAHFIYE